ncbi:sugar transferase [Oculatella sp. LEGE 06141]|uniref:sugar transferase n=1 Tax=Oculatella sp. LEGE 06141 TaxID=1828648 RepID=UPI001880EAC4|nr:sugar transferase [Oculatella sp. LEGE 06141]MBE9177160.1 sugar transferase [Oculatella sp. LEGE 06141]
MLIAPKRLSHVVSIAGRHHRLTVSSVHPSVTSKTKRCIDIAGAVIGLLLTAALFIPIAIAICLDSPGPILYSQIRCGYQGHRFRMWKFRSMVPNAEQLKQQIPNQAKGHIFKNDNDPRMTRVGQFLRRTSLDELPQFWNVLRGEMSLVGFRPPTVDEVSHYNDRHRKRLHVKPGITGEWQVNGRSCILNFETVINLDLRYHRRWSVAYDLHLIWKTIGVVLHRRGAC